MWCLAYHNHLRRELIPTGTGPTSKEIRSTQRHEELPAAPSSSNHQNVVIDTQEIYIVETGETVPLYAKPSLDALLTGEQVIGRSEVSSDGWVSNSEGVWIRMQGTHKYILLEVCYSKFFLYFILGTLHGSKFYSFTIFLCQW